MRSSLSVNPSKVTAWQPPELTGGLVHPGEKDVRALIDVFRAEAAANTALEGDCVVAAPKRSVPQPWEPADFGQPLPPEGGASKGEVYFPFAGSYTGRGGGTVEAGRREADGLVANALQQAEQIRTEASQAAAEEFARARAEGYAAGQAEWEQQLSAIREVFEQTNAWREELFAASEPIVLQLVKSIAVTLFGHGVVLSDSALQQNLNRIVEQAKALGDLKIYLNPADAAILDPDWREFQSSITGNKVQVISSDSIIRGGAFVQGQMGTVDGRVETQLKAVLDALAGPGEGEGSQA